jgi:hypothetical protein
MRPHRAFEISFVRGNISPTTTRIETAQLISVAEKCLSSVIYKSTAGDPRKTVLNKIIESNNSTHPDS